MESRGFKHTVSSHDIIPAKAELSPLNTKLLNTSVANEFNNQNNCEGTVSLISYLKLNCVF